MERATALKLVTDELDRIEEHTNHSSLFTPHEGWAVIKEEMDELWEEVRGGGGTGHYALTEAVQIAAAALRYLTDLCDEQDVPQHDYKVETWAERKMAAHRASRTGLMYPPSPAGGGAGGYSG